MSYHIQVPFTIQIIIEFNESIKLRVISPEIKPFLPLSNQKPNDRNTKRTYRDIYKRKTINTKKNKQTNTLEYRILDPKFAKTTDKST